MFFDVAEEYRMKAGVYAIVNTVNKKMYVGSTKCFYHRFGNHLAMFSRKEHSCRYLQCFVNKHGEGILTFTMLEYVDDIRELDMREQYYLNMFFAFKLLFNHAEDARSPMRGRKLTKETKMKIGLALKGRKGRKLSEEHKKKLLLFNKGIARGPRSEEVKEKIRLGNIGKTRSEETKRKIGLSKIGNKNQYSRGAVMSEETKKKIGMGQRKRYLTKVSLNGV